MKKAIDIYNYDRMQQSMLAMLHRSPTSDANKATVEKFCNFCVASGIGKPRVIKYLRVLRQLAEWLGKDFESVTKDDIERVVTKIHSNESYTEWTKKDYNIALKKFYKWLKGNNEEYPLEVKWLRTSARKNRLMLPSREGLLTQEDIKKLLEMADHPRNKALISLLYESGARIGEIASMQINSITFDEKGAIIVIHGKTGSRRIRVVSSVPYLLTWINSHPFRDTRDAPLWINVGPINFRKHMKYGALRKVLSDTFERAKIKKRFNPHLFRHSRATFLANYLTEAQLKVYFGWVQGSDVAGTYVHLSGRDTDHKILEINGIVEEDIKKKKDELMPKICPRCEAMNAYSSKYCSKCSSILDTETAMLEQEKIQREDTVKTVSNDVMAMLMQDADVQQMLVGKIRELGLGKMLKKL